MQIIALRWYRSFVITICTPVQFEVGIFIHTLHVFSWLLGCLATSFKLTKQLASSIVAETSYQRRDSLASFPVLCTTVSVGDTLILHEGSEVTISN